MIDVIIIGGGWSVRHMGVDGMDLTKHGHVIGVNESAARLPCHVGLTMDRLWAEHRAREFFLSHPNAELWVRDGADKALPYHPRLRKFWCDHRSYVLSEEAGVFNGTNSGLCAINFAFQMRPKRIFLFGFDMVRGPLAEPYWHPPYEWANQQGATKPAKYVSWARQFEAVAEQLANAKISVHNVTTRSAIEAFPKMTLQEFIRATSKAPAEHP